MREYTLKITSELRRLARQEGTTPEKIIQFVLLTMTNLGYYVEEDEEGNRVKDIVEKIGDLSVVVSASTNGYTKGKMKIIRNLKVIRNEESI